MGKALWNVAVSRKGGCRQQARGPSAEFSAVCHRCAVVLNVNRKKSRGLFFEAALP